MELHIDGISIPFVTLRRGTRSFECAQGKAPRYGIERFPFSLRERR